MNFFLLPLFLFATAWGEDVRPEIDPFSTELLERLGLLEKDVAIDNPQSARNLEDAAIHAHLFVAAIRDETKREAAEERVDIAYDRLRQKIYRQFDTVRRFQTTAAQGISRAVRAQPNARLAGVSRFLAEGFEGDEKLVGWRGMAAMRDAYTQAMLEEGCAAFFTPSQSIEFADIFSVGIYIEPKGRAEFWSRARVWLDSHPEGKALAKIAKDFAGSKDAHAWNKLLRVVELPPAGEVSPWYPVFRDQFAAMHWAKRPFDELYARIGYVGSQLGREYENVFVPVPMREIVLRNFFEDIRRALGLGEDVRSALHEWKTMTGNTRAPEDFLAARKQWMCLRASRPPFSLN